MLAAFLASAPAWTLGLWRHCRRLEARGARPIVQPALMQAPSYRQGLLLALMSNGIVPGYLFVLTFAWQLGAGLSATQMSLLCMPIALGALLGIAFLGRLAFARWGARCIAVGLGLQAAGIGLMAAVCVGALGSPVHQVLSWPGLLSQGLLGLGIGFIGPPLTAVTLQSVPGDQTGGASGTFNAVGQLSAVGAIALMATLMRGPAAAHAPTTLLQALPGLGVLLAAGVWLAWRLQGAITAAGVPDRGAEVQSAASSA
jgi:hypothetical protein